MKIGAMIKTIRNIDFGVEYWLDCFEIYYDDGTVEINCQPYPIEKPIISCVNTSHYQRYFEEATKEYENDLIEKEERLEEIRGYFLEKCPLKYYQRVVAIILKHRGILNTPFSVLPESLKSTQKYICVETLDGKQNFQFKKENINQYEYWYQAVKINLNYLSCHD
jgi:hypothetical protein